MNVITGLIPSGLHERLANRIQVDEDFDGETADRILDAALQFLHFCATHKGTWAPSALVDIGWHTFLLYTRDYQRFCNRYANRFIHHNPTDDPDMDSDLPTAADTYQAMVAAGYQVDKYMWLACKHTFCSESLECVAPCTSQADQPLMTAMAGPCSGDQCVGGSNCNCGGWCNGTS